MSDMRIFVLAGAFVLGAAAPAAAEGGSSDHRRIQNSIYDVLFERYEQGYPAESAPPETIEGRASAEGPPPRQNEWERRQNSQDPYYFRHESQTND